MNSNVIQFLVNMGISASLMLVPNMAQGFGASNFQIGLVVGVYNFMAFFSHYIFGRASDAYGRRIFLFIGLFFAGVCFATQVYAKDYMSLFIVRAVAGFSIGIFPAALIAYVYESKGSIGRFSSYGSLGWAFGSLMAGLISDYGEIFIGSSIVFFLAFLSTFKLEENRRTIPNVEIPLFPSKMIKKNFDVYFPFFLRHVGGNLIWTIFPLYLASLGASPLWIGFLYFINTGTQFVVMRHLDRFDNRLLIKAGEIMSVVVFFSYALASSYMHIIPMQFLLAVSWSFLYVGSVSTLTKENVEKATAVSILSSFLSLSAILGPLLSGIITQLYGYRSVMYAGGFTAIAGFFFTMWAENLKNTKHHSR